MNFISKKFIYENYINETSIKENIPCNTPIKSNRPGKKRMVKVCENGKEKIIHYGAVGYGHNYSDSARRSFRARHKCDEQTNRFSAAYWACKDLWAGPSGDKLNPPSKK